VAGGQLNVTVYDWDQQAAGLLYRLYRLVRLQRQVSRGAPLSQDRSVERLALLSYAAQDAGVPMPRLRALVQAGQEAAVLAYEHHDGTTLADYAPEPTDAQLGQVWDDVLQLHARRVTHRALTADHMLLTDDGHVLLLPTPTGDIAASDLQIRLDRAQLMSELALLVGPDRSADLALAKIPTAEIINTVPLLQAVALSRSTRHELRRRRAVLPALRKRLLAHVPGGEVAPVHLERIRLRTLVTLIATVVAGYLLAGELARDSLSTVVRHADWRWGIVALGLSAVTYFGAALSLTGFVTERLSFWLTVLAQLASSFVTLVTPAAVGGAAVNIRYLQRRKIPAAIAAASVGVSQVVAFVMHISLLVIFIALSGTSESDPIKLPVVAYFIIAGVVAIAATVAALPAGRRLLRARVAPTINQVLPHLLQIAQHPRKLAEGIGGTLLLSAAYIGCLAVCIRALGGSVPIASVAVVYLTASAAGSLVPTPGGLGAIEALMSAGLTAAGMQGAAALSAVLLYRLLTFWLPVPIGWVALKQLERRQAL
jgi:glycosyltransferase 2 family protein